MKTSTAVIVVVVLLILLGGGWYYYTKQPAMPVAPAGNAGLNGSPDQGNLGGANTGTPPQQPGSTGQGDGTRVSQNLVLGVAGDVTKGQYLTAFNGMTLYSYSKDAKGVSNCTGQCAVNWPPYTVDSPSDINVSAATPGTVGTIARADGSLQVTYNGVPLYYYIKDTKPGDTTGQNVGGVWFLVKP